ncbi:hypothetical protein CEH05_18155 [Halobacillus halophilus]|uniref:Uncharacterized protein n=1 Tax=Halobacillus halophilus (strain ATCC 35676 / DSM 2266 / JCM 20832 / KCTC 3685 / LMG 17431 / NBRC 102448 / NCIMB 2269) TaxID=866895 RepID=I0JSB7_HALH3|nr:hypothetical protein [Halobacillus halophilus]ASF40975.1 hypothetical protein CEH05_18155 [Halobacillus halophilus]CCG47039.1 conserved hypothetical protein [Halobacillus halophilus DSM 2266]
MKRRVLFGVFVALLIILTSMNIYAAQTIANDDLQKEVQQLEEKNETIMEEKKELKKTLQKQKPADIQARYNALVKQVSTFIEVVFQQDKETYQERKKEAPKMMSNDLAATFFPTETYKGDRKTEVEEVEIYIKTGNLTNNQASVFVRFKHTLLSLQSDQKQVSPVFLHIKVHREEGHWKITDFQHVEEGGYS